MNNNLKEDKKQVDEFNPGPEETVLDTWISFRFIKETGSKKNEVKSD